MAPAKKRVRADTQVGPYRSSSSLHPIQKNGRGQRPVPTGLSWCQASGRCRHRPLRKGGAAATTLASGAQRSVCAAVTRDGWRVRQRSPPKVSSNLGQSLSRLTATAPFAQGSLALRGTGDADCRVAALLAMTTVFCHSEASAHTGRGNPSFLRWTGVRAAEVVGPYGRSTEVPATGRCT